MFKPKALYCEKEIENYNLGRELLEKYADVLIEKGVNIQKGQYLLLQCCIDTLPLARIICEKALLKGAKDVHVSISDPVV